MVGQPTSQYSLQPWDVDTGLIGEIDEADLVNETDFAM